MQKSTFPKSFHNMALVGLGPVEAFTGPTWRPWPVPGPMWRPWPVPRGGLHRSYVEALAGPTYRPSPVLCGGLGPTWRPWPVLTWRPSPILCGGLGRSDVEAFTGPTWRPWPVPRGGLHRSHMEALAGPTWRPSLVPCVEALASPTWRPSPVLCGGVGGRSHVEALVGSMWRPSPVPRGGLGPVPCMWRPSPVLRGGLGQSHVEAFTSPMWRPWPVPHVEAFTGPTWRPPYLAGARLSGVSLINGGAGHTFPCQRPSPRPCRRPFCWTPGITPPDPRSTPARIRSTDYISTKFFAQDVQKHRVLQCFVAFGGHDFRLTGRRWCRICVPRGQA